MSRSRFVTGFLLGAPLAFTVAAAVVVTNVVPGLLDGRFTAQVGGGIVEQGRYCCTNGSCVSNQFNPDCSPGKTPAYTSLSQCQAACGGGGGGGNKQCSDLVDNADAEDTLADAADPDCHSDGNPSNAATYDPNDNDETNGSGDGDVDICTPICGDGKKLGTEQCDDGNKNDTDSCSNQCKNICVPGTICPNNAVCPQNGICPDPICGDGKKEGNEECDDGNTANGDGCSSLCRIEVRSSSSSSVKPSIVCCNQSNSWCERKSECGVTETSYGQDMNGCIATCGKKPGSSSSASSICPDCIPPGCGDGVKVDSEECDDGNTKDGDGCTKQCKIERFPTCPADPCGKGGTDFCKLQGKTCELKPDSPSCITCVGEPYECTGQECTLGGNAYCSKIGKKTCAPTPDGICINCKTNCLGNECSLAGDKYCSLFGKVCSADPGSDACISCAPEPPIACSGTDMECKMGGDKYCTALGATCTPDNDGICIECKPKNPCAGGECALGGTAFCSRTRGAACQETGEGLCIRCGGQESYACQGNECRKGGAAYCGALGDGCENVSTGICIRCTDNTTCKSDLQCEQGSSCINGNCVKLCGNGRLDSGELCDPSVRNGAAGCTAGCLLAPNQQCARDTECGSTLCVRNICVPCTEGGQCQSRDCREGACENLCGNGNVDAGEICDPGLVGTTTAECTRDCLRPPGVACAKSFECQTGFCTGGACIRCQRNNQCAGNLCVSGDCADVCGNGTLDRGEECDDGNRRSNDGCSTHCERDARVAGEILPINLLGDVTVGGVTADGRTIATGHPAAGQTGPAAVIAIAGGAAAGWSYMRRRRQKN